MKLFRNQLKNTKKLSRCELIIMAMLVVFVIVAFILVKICLFEFGL